MTRIETWYDLGMKLKATRKLVLQKESLRKLTSEQLREVDGGLRKDGPFSVGNCPTEGTSLVALNCGDQTLKFPCIPNTNVTTC